MDRISWDERKRASNLSRHGLDFAHAWLVFESPILQKVDTRKDYGEVRYVALGLLVGRIVVLVYTGAG